jgi:hypothetical protein
MDEGIAYETGIEGYTFLYPLVLMDMTRKQATNVEKVGQISGRGPADTFVHMREFPAAGYRDVVRPNFDTLYSAAWIDLSKEPRIVSVPAAGGNYYLLPFYDMWGEVFAVPGTRTTGGGAGTFAIVGPDWSGTLPEGVRRYDAPTPWVWIIGRTEASPETLDKVHAFQDGMTLTPLSAWGRKAPAVKGQIDPSVDGKTPPLRQVFGLSATDFFRHAAELLKQSGTHFQDYPVRDRLERIGFRVGESFDLGAAEPTVRSALEKAAADAQKRIVEHQKVVGRMRNGWLMNTETMGNYGTDYLKRATVELAGLGANLQEDAIYPLAFVDDRGHPLTGKNRYVLHFDKKDLPPALAFWSLTLYDEEGFQVANELNRFAIGDRNPLVFNPDGSLDLFIQRAAPAADKKANWLPAPEGPFNLCLRIYYPKREALDGRWLPPGIRDTGSAATTAPAVATA